MAVPSQEDKKRIVSIPDKFDTFPTSILIRMISQQPSMSISPEYVARWRPGLSSMLLIQEVQSKWVSLIKMNYI